MLPPPRAFEVFSSYDPIDQFYVVLDFANDTNSISGAMWA